MAPEIVQVFRHKIQGGSKVPEWHHNTEKVFSGDGQQMYHIASSIITTHHTSDYHHWS
jgi:hypothetical protein